LIDQIQARTNGFSSTPNSAPAPNPVIEFERTARQLLALEIPCGEKAQRLARLGTAIKHYVSRLEVELQRRASGGDQRALRVITQAASTLDRLAADVASKAQLLTAKSRSGSAGRKQKAGGKEETVPPTEL
jgi:hypothetical protein